MIITGKKFSKPEMSRVINGDTILKPENQKLPKTRLDHILVQEHPEFNRSTLQNFIKSGYVTVDGQIVKKPNTEILDDPRPEIILTVPERETPPDLKNHIIYEDENVLAVNKPAGLLSMAKGEYTEEHTLEDYGLLVHRLDRDTSGIVILAKNEATQSFLRKQFQDRKTKKTYYAIIAGRPKLDAALIDLPIARNIKHPTTFLVDANGKPSQTNYRVIKSVEKLDKHNHKKTYSLVELHPTTGRTHQLRVHLKYLGCPIIGDKVYGENAEDYDRLYLHAHELEITIPNTDKNDTNGLRKTFTADLPQEFTDFLEG